MRQFTLWMLMLFGTPPFVASPCGLAEQLNYKVLAKQLLCVSDGIPIRRVVVLLKKVDFTPTALEKIASEISSQIARPEELTVSIETDEEIAQRSITLQPGGYHNPELRGELRKERNRLTAKRTQRAFINRYGANMILRYTRSAETSELDTVVLEGSDFTFSDRLGFYYEILSSSFTTLYGDKECQRRDLEVLLAEKDFAENGLSRLFQHLSEQYPTPRKLKIKVYTSDRQPQDGLMYKSRVPGFGLARKATNGHYLGATFFREAGKAYFYCTVYPFIVNEYGGLKTQRIDLQPVN